MCFPHYNPVAVRILSAERYVSDGGLIGSCQKDKYVYFPEFIHDLVDFFLC